MHASAAPAAALQPKKDGRAHHGAAIDDAGAQGSTRSESVRWVEGAAAPTLHAEAVRPARICLERHAWLPLVTAEPRMGALIAGPQIHTRIIETVSVTLCAERSQQNHTHTDRIVVRCLIVWYVLRSVVVL